MDRGAWWATVHGVKRMTEQQRVHTLSTYLLKEEKVCLASAGALDYSVDLTL